jgi:tetratricopeptide (TPR) repeat protein
MESKRKAPKEKSSHGKVAAIVILIILAAGGISLWLYVRNNQAANLARQIASLGNGGTPQSIADLKKGIELYGKDIDRLVKDHERTATYYRILASRYQDQGMHREALDALEEAIKIDSDNATYFYMTGISATYVANGSLDWAKDGHYDANTIRNRYYAMAEDAFKRAIAIDPAYSRPYYGLALLYTEYMDKPSEAIPLLLKYNTIVKNDWEAYGELAKAYYMTGQYKECISCYETLLTFSLSKDQKAQVNALKQQAWNKLYG